jgi:hypothetical protein
LKTSSSFSFKCKSLKFRVCEHTYLFHKVSWRPATIAKIKQPWAWNQKLHS